jgi:hypothetical protein
VRLPGLCPLCLPILVPSVPPCSCAHCVSLSLYPLCLSFCVLCVSLPCAPCVSLSCAAYVSLAFWPLCVTVLYTPCLHRQAPSSSVSSCPVPPASPSLCVSCISLPFGPLLSLSSLYVPPISCPLYICLSLCPFFTLPCIHSPVYLPVLVSPLYLHVLVSLYISLSLYPSVSPSPCVSFISPPSCVPSISPCPRVTLYIPVTVSHLYLPRFVSLLHFPVLVSPLYLYVLASLSLLVQLLVFPSPRAPVGHALILPMSLRPDPLRSPRHVLKCHNTQNIWYCEFLNARMWLCRKGNETGNLWGYEMVGDWRQPSGWRRINLATGVHQSPHTNHRSSI